MALGGHSKPIVSKWTLDNKQVKRSLTEVNQGLELTKKAFHALAQGMDTVMSTGFKYNNLQRNLKFSIDEARASTLGLVDDMSLMQAASRSSAFGLGLNAKQFASLARAATIAAKRMGVDVNSAIGDMITGMARMSPKILDNLGITISANDAYLKYAKSIGKSKSELSKAEQQTAFTTEAMRKLNIIAAEGTLKIKDNAGAFMVMKTTMKNAFAGFSAHIAKGKELTGVLKALGEAAEGAAKWFTSSKRSDARLQVRDLMVARGKAQQELHGLQGPANSIGGSTVAANNALEGARAKLEAKIKAYDEEIALMQAALKSGAFTTPGQYSGYDPTRGLAGPDKWGTKDVGKKKKKRISHGKTYDPFAAENRTAANEADYLYDEAAAKAKLAAKKRDFAAEEKMNALRLKQKVEMIRFDEDVGRKHRAQVEATEELYRKTDHLKKMEYDRFKQLQGMGLQAVTGMATGMWDLAASMAASGEISGQAFLQLTSSIILGIAKQATVKAIFETAEGFAALANPFLAWTAPAHFTAAKTFGMVAVGAGAVGIGLAAAGGAVGRGGGTSAGKGFGKDFAPSTGGVRQREQRDTTIVIRYDQSDPAQRRMADRKMRADLARMN